MDAMTFAASRMSTYRHEEVQRTIALRAAHARRAEARRTAETAITALPSQADLALAGPSR
jgi:hypothetical protein